MKERAKMGNYGAKYSKAKAARHSSQSLDSVLAKIAKFNAYHFFLLYSVYGKCMPHNQCHAVAFTWSPKIITTSYELMEIVCSIPL